MESPDAWHMTDDLNVAHGKGDPFAAAIRATRMPMIITDPRQHDNPIIFVNEAFLRLTGYGREEIIGRNCRFLQGPDTDPSDVAKLREAVRTRDDCEVELLNYRKDGTSFWNALYMSPVVNEAGELLYFFASQLDVTERRQAEMDVRSQKERFEAEVVKRTSELRAAMNDLQAALDSKNVLLHEVDHRVKNNLQMISSLIYMQSRGIADPAVRASLVSMLERIESIATVHRRLYQSKDVSSFDVAEFVRDLVPDIVSANGRTTLKEELDLEPVTVPAEKAAALALLLNELVTNSLKHAFPNPNGLDAGGTVTVRVKMATGEGGRNLVLTVEDDGVGRHDLPGLDMNGRIALTMAKRKPGDPPVGGFGTTLIETLARQLRGRATAWNASPGHRVEIVIPLEGGPRNASMRTAADGAIPRPAAALRAAGVPSS